MKLREPLILFRFVFLFCTPWSVFAQPFQLEDLPYSTDALEPVIDQLIMEIHHGRHHQAYVDNLNAQVEAFPELADISLAEMMKEISQFTTAVRNNGGGHYNHTLFWEIMAPENTGAGPSHDLISAVEREFGSLAGMKKLFAEAAATRFGSGWAWLIVTPEGDLKVTSTANQDNPLMDVIPEDEQGTPLLALDVWEHAYYLSYQNRRGDYLNHWWRVVNWNEVNRRFKAAVGEES
ncbi:superoxide dismutase [Chitinivibrio alkaliphilus]|uniref:Superoxide dismutase n=1 Tax=Chitinivibrio alkaliphilus ACht1 TaxID=1313304 RepID=U7D603_9BACT|nr:superoxide dismutase [Chitinivibrio alkaliphilus]ERP31006.1 superoxide dismutase [Chitinivibrio alkaliphilus ACht1]